VSESRDLQRLGGLLALQGIGTFEITAVGSSAWLMARNLRRTLPSLEPLCWEREPQIGVVPLAKPGSYLRRVDSSLLWARTDTGGEASALRSFRPAPTVVIRHGGVYVAFWALWEPLDDDWRLRANKRIAHRLGAKKKYAGDNFGVPLPGTILRFGRGRPQPVELVRYEPELRTAREVVGHLREAPDPAAWRSSMNAGQQSFA
jgi:hypothetical protein